MRIEWNTTLSFQNNYKTKQILDRSITLPDRQYVFDYDRFSFSNRRSPLSLIRTHRPVPVPGVPWVFRKPPRTLAARWWPFARWFTGVCTEPLRARWPRRIHYRLKPRRSFKPSAHTHPYQERAFTVADDGWRSTIKVAVRERDSRTDDRLCRRIATVHGGTSVVGRRWFRFYYGWLDRHARRF